MRSFQCSICHKFKPIEEAIKYEYPLKIEQKVDRAKDRVQVEVTKRYAVICQSCSSRGKILGSEKGSVRLEKT